MKKVKGLIVLTSLVFLIYYSFVYEHLELLLIPLSIIFYKLYCFVCKYFYYKKSLFEIRENFINILNHDLKVSTLAQIRGLDWVIGQTENVEEREILNEINNSCKYTLDMISTLVDTYSFDAGMGNFYYEVCSPNEVLSFACDKLTQMLNKKEIKVKYYICSDSCFKIDKRAFLNLVENLFMFAIQHSYKKSVIVVLVKEKNGYLEFNIGFNGENLSIKNCEKFFTKGFKYATVGQSIKLQMCKKIVEAHGGKISVFPKGNNINCFTFTIPVFKEEAVPEPLVTQVF